MPSSGSHSKHSSSSPYSSAAYLSPSTISLLTHLHPVILLSVYALNFNTLVHGPSGSKSDSNSNSNPNAGNDTTVDALFSSLLPLILVQIGYVVCCLDSVGGGSGGSSTSSTSSGSSSKKVGGRSLSNSIHEKLLPTILSLSLTLLLSFPTLLTALILFGAPLTTHLPQTALTAIHISFLTTFPLIYVHQVDSTKWKNIIAVTLPIDEVFGASLGAVVGAWGGAVPIPLDWDREWQKYPVTIVTGAYVGYVLGKVGGMYILRGKKLV